MRLLLGLIPPWGWLLLGGLVLATVTGYHLHAVHQGKVAGRQEVQARWDAVELERERTANADRLRRAEAAMRESTEHEATRARIARLLQESRHAQQAALRRPIVCPAAGGALGDLVLPADALAGVRAAAGGGQRPD